MIEMINKNMKTTEDKIYSNQDAYDIYDNVIKDMVHYQFDIKTNEKLENYEICKELVEKIQNLIAIRSVQISRLLKISSDDVFDVLNKDYKKLIKEIEKEKL